MRRWPFLDGLRACAALAVIGYHLRIPRVMRGGYVGVDLFFVISGFLITTLLAEEQDRTGGIAFGSFYARRALRLLPALVAMTVAALCIAALTGVMVDSTMRAAPLTMLYVLNWSRASSSFTGGLLGHTWTLAVEEQFYLVWPLVLAVVAGVRRERAAALLLALAVCDVGYRQVGVVLGWSGARLYFATDTRAVALLAGAAIAMWRLSHSWREGSPRLRRGASWAGTALLCGLALVPRGSPELAVLSVPLATVASALVIWSLLGGAPIISSLLEQRPLQWIGKRSYGLYLWAYPITEVLARAPIATWQRVVLSFVVSLVAAALSFRFIERPFLQLKDRLRPGSASADPEPLAAHVLGP